MCANLQKHLCVHIDEVPPVCLREHQDYEVLSGGCDGAFLLTEEALEQHDLTEADDKQQDGFSDGPVGDSLQEMLGFHAVVCLSEPVPRLRVGHHLQDLMDGDARWLQLKLQRSAEINQEHRNDLG